jgi:hypothetical protein
MPGSHPVVRVTSFEIACQAATFASDGWPPSGRRVNPEDNRFSVPRVHPAMLSLAVKIEAVARSKSEFMLV